MEIYSSCMNCRIIHVLTVVFYCAGVIIVQHLFYYSIVIDILACMTI